MFYYFLAIFVCSVCVLKGGGGGLAGLDGGGGGGGGGMDVGVTDKGQDENSNDYIYK